MELKKTVSSILLQPQYTFPGKVKDETKSRGVTAKGGSIWTQQEGGKQGEQRL